MKRRLVDQSERKAWLARQKDVEHAAGFSDQEEADLIALIDLGIPYAREHRFDDCVFKRCLPFDFYLPEHKAVIEFHGSQHPNLPCRAVALNRGAGRRGERGRDPLPGQRHGRRSEVRCESQADPSITEGADEHGRTDELSEESGPWTG
jgi:hypothetical protein